MPPYLQTPSGIVSRLLLAMLKISRLCILPMLAGIPLKSIWLLLTYSLRRLVSRHSEFCNISHMCYTRLRVYVSLHIHTESVLYIHCRCVSWPNSCSLARQLFLGLTAVSWPNSCSLARQLFFGLTAVPWPDSCSLARQLFLGPTAVPWPDSCSLAQQLSQRTKHMYLKF